MTIGDQIKQARKAKGMTQDSLAEALNIGRTVVSKWETGSRIPDGEMLLRLSKLLDWSFVDEDAVPAPVETDEAPRAEAASAQEAEASPAPQPDETAKEASPAPARRKRKTALIAAIAVLVLALGGLLVWRLTAPKASDIFYTDANGVAYTVENFKQPAPREDGKAYLRVDSTLTINSGDTTSFWMFDFTYHELNGIALKVDRIEQVYLTADKRDLQQIITAADLEAYGMTTDIPAFGDWSYQGGLPVQKDMLGVGVLLRCTDANGAPLTFTSFLSFAN